MHGAFFAGKRRFYKRGEKRVGCKRARQKFRMKLRSQKERVLFFGKLGYFHEPAVRRNTGEFESGNFKLADIFWIHFIAMTVAFIYSARLVGVFGDSALF